MHWKEGEPVAAFDVEVGRDPVVPGPRGRDPEREPLRLAGRDGRAVVPDLLVGGYDVTIRADGFAPRWVATGVAAPSTTLRVELRPANARLRGRVEDEAGRPLPGARVHLAAADGGAILPSKEGSAIADADGMFVFAAIPEGRYGIVAEAEDLAPAAVTAAAMSAESAAESEPVLRLRAGFDVVIDAESEGVSVTDTLSMRIRDERGAALHDDHRFPSSLTTRSGMGFRFRLVPGRYTVELHSPRFELGRATFVAKPGERVVVEMKRL